MYMVINNYQSNETLPYVVSVIDTFSRFDDAMKAAKDNAEDAMVNEYVEKYRADKIEMKTTCSSVYIKGPNFIDWWSIVEV